LAGIQNRLKEGEGMELNETTAGSDPQAASNATNLTKSSTAPYPGYFYDIKELVGHFDQSAKTCSFTEFKQVWSARKLSYIHQAKPRQMEYEEWMQRLFSSTLGFLHIPSTPFKVLMGALYCLYALYSTQLRQPRSLIRVSLETWKHLEQLHERVKERQIWDAYHIFRKLYKDRCFCFTAYAPVGPRSAPSASVHIFAKLPPDLQQADTLKNVVDLGAIERIARMYHNAKQRAQKTAVPEAFTSTLPSGVLNVANAHLESDIRSMLSEMERAYQTSDRGQ